MATRGVRNNNPLNIRIGNTWLGESKGRVDSDFEVFISMRYGLRAAFIILRRYIRKYNRNTIRKIINAWAPSNENNTEKYISFVASQTKIDADAVLDFDEKLKICIIVRAMARMESGIEIPLKELEISYEMA